MPDIRLSFLYATYFGIYGILFPYLGRYLSAFGYSFQEISLFMACLTGINIVAPFTLARLSDILQVRLPLARAGVLLLILAVLLLDPGAGFYRVIIPVILAGAALSVTLPQIEAVVLNYLGSQSHRYGLLRSWGAVGFSLVVWVSGPVIEHSGTEWFRYILLATAVALLITTFTLRDPEPVSGKDEAQQGPAQGSGIRLLAVPFTAALFFVCMINQSALAPYNSFVYLYWQQQGMAVGDISLLLAVAPVCETLFMFSLPFLLRRAGYFPVLITALAASILRWLLMATLADSFWVMLFSQSVHALSFGAMHGVAIYLISRVFSAAHRGMGQSLYMSIVSGAGLVAGNLYAGQIWQGGQGASLAFYSSALFCLLALMVSLIWIRPSRGPEGRLV